jgi:Fur family ferric uptake transcriptional regulator
LLRAAGLRVTKSRVRVLHELAVASVPLSHKDVVARLASTAPDRATVHRNLTDLTGAGLVRRTDLGDHLWRYELVTKDIQPRPVLRFFCGACGAISPLPDPAIELRRVAQAPQALAEASISVHVHGVCDACR